MRSCFRRAVRRSAPTTAACAIAAVASAPRACRSRTSFAFWPTRTSTAIFHWRREALPPCRKRSRRYVAAIARSARSTAPTASGWPTGSSAPRNCWRRGKIAHAGTLLPGGRLAGEEREDFENLRAFGWVETEISPIAVAGGEARGSIGFHNHGAWLGAAEVAMLRPHGLESAGEIPCGPVEGHLVISAVGFRDGVRARVCEIVFDAGGGIEQVASNFVATEHDGGWPALEDGLGGGDVDADVVLGLSTFEVARHGDDEGDLLFGERGAIGEIQQRSEIGAATGLHDHD